MSSKAELKRVRGLHDKKARIREGRFLVQGAKLVKELLASGWPMDAVYATADAALSLGLSDAVVLPANEMARLGTLESGNELVAVVPIPAPSPPPMPGAGELVLALDGISDPGNLGTILRIADWFGVGHVLCSAGSVEAWNPKCVQSGMGAVFRVQVHYVDLAAELAAMKAAGVALYMATMEGRPVFDVSLSRPAALLLGSESHGISPLLRSLGGVSIAVPRSGGAESLNVAMATSALCMEFHRQSQAVRH